MNDLGLIQNYTAGATIAQRLLLAFSATAGEVVPATGPTDKLMGVSGIAGAAAAGDRIDVYMDGIRDLKFGGVVAQGDPITSDANGQAVAATGHTHVENTAAAYVQNAATAAGSNVRIIGYALCDAVAGDIGPVHILPGNL